MENLTITMTNKKGVNYMNNQYGYWHEINGKLMLFASEEDYLEYISEE